MSLGEGSGVEDLKERGGVPGQPADSRPTLAVALEGNVELVDEVGGEEVGGAPFAKGQEAEVAPLSG